MHDGHPLVGFLEARLTDDGTLSREDVEAKRRILAEIVPETNDMDQALDSEFRSTKRDTDTEPYIGERLLRILAAPYANHQDYRDEWRP
jgi:hypothetical protein